MRGRNLEINERRIEIKMKTQQKSTKPTSNEDKNGNFPNVKVLGVRADFQALTFKL